MFEASGVGQNGLADLPGPPSTDEDCNDMMKILSSAALLVACAALPVTEVQAQTAFKCPDANGRLALQDTPCQGGKETRINPASGLDPRHATTKQPTAPQESPTTLKDRVDRMSIERRGRELSYELRDANALRRQLEIDRDARIRAVEAEFTTARSEIAINLFIQQQQARIINLRLDYQSRIAEQDARIRSIEQQIDSQRQDLAKAKPTL